MTHHPSSVVLTLSCAALCLSVFACGNGDVEVYNSRTEQPNETTAPEDAGVRDTSLGDRDEDAAAPAPDASSDLGPNDTSPDVAPDVPPEPDDDCPRVRVTSGVGNRLNVRPQPNTDQAAVGSLYHGMVLTKLDTVTGLSVAGTDVWYEVEGVGLRGFISAAYAECTEDAITELAPPAGFYLPLECDTSARISQGNNGSFSHVGLSRYAWDFAIPLRTPMVAIADGLVLHTYAGTAEGSACDGGGQECVLYANHVVLLHGDDTTSTYRHLSRVDVAIGQFVPRGAQVGLSGKTGWSTGPHAHVQRMTNCGSAFPPQESVCQSIPTKFEDVSVNGGVPPTGATVTSGNCIPLRN